MWPPVNCRKECVLGSWTIPKLFRASWAEGLRENTANARRYVNILKRLVRWPDLFSCWSFQNWDWARDWASVSALPTSLSSSLFVFDSEITASSFAEKCFSISEQAWPSSELWRSFRRMSKWRVSRQDSLSLPALEPDVWHSLRTALWRQEVQRCVWGYGFWRFFLSSSSRFAALVLRTTCTWRWVNLCSQAASFWEARAKRYNSEHPPAWTEIQSGVTASCQSEPCRWTLDRNPVCCGKTSWKMTVTYPSETEWA